MTDEQTEVFTDDDKAIIDELENQELLGSQDTEDTTESVEVPAQSTDSVAEESTDEIGDDLRERATAYGLNPDHFDSADRLEAQVNDLEGRWVEWARQQRAAQQQVPQQAQQTEQVDGQQPEIPFRLELDPEEYPQEIIDGVNNALKQVHDYYAPIRQQVEQMNQYIQAQTQYLQQQQWENEVQQFMGAVEDLGHKQLFGDGTPNTTQQQASNLQKLYQEAEVLADSYRLRGMRVPPVKELVKRAERLAFADQLDQYEKQTRNARLTKQANQKLGSGKRSNEAFVSQGDWDGEDADNPVLIKAWNDMVAAQGEQ